MDSKKTTKGSVFRRLPYKWRLLVPSLGLMWLVLIIATTFQYQREGLVRRKSMEKAIDMIGNNVLDAYAGHYSTDNLHEFMDFVSEYYDHTRYEDVRISLYNYDGTPIYFMGDRIPFEMRKYDRIGTDDITPEQEALLGYGSRDSAKPLFTYSTMVSPDGKLYVLTAMPLNSDVSVIIERASYILWIFLAAMIISTLVVYLFVHHQSKSVKLMSRFVDEVSAGRNVSNLSEDDFPRDEFGTISSQIVKLWKEKDEAVQAQEAEHTVALNAIREKEKLKREMTNNISHELKTPIGIIKGYVETIVGDPSMDAETMRYFVERTQPNVERLCSLLNDISTVTRLEDGSTEIPVSAIDFHDLVYTLVSDIRLSGVLKDMQLKFNIPENCIVKGNANLLTGVIQNLIRNSAIHSHGTKMALDYDGDNDRYYTFRFYDDGVGVPEESVSRLFDRFYRVSKGRSRRGGGDTGLGLSIVQSAINNLGGAISVKNISTGGLEFIFTLEKWKPATQD